MIGLGFVFFNLTAIAQVDTSAFHQALKIKKELYYNNGAITGGDRGFADFRITQIRMSSSPEGFDRVVLDFSGNNNGAKVPLAHPPYYQVEVNGSQKVIHITLYGKPKLEFSTTAVTKAAKRTKNISKVELLPVVEQDRWTFSLRTQPGVKVEVFELTDPARLILDLKR